MRTALAPSRPPGPPRAAVAPPARRAFSLVELLVVIGIIALLVGILMPTLSAVQREGRKTVCMSNLRQIGMAVTLYVDHHKGKYPRAPALPSVNPYNLPTTTQLLAPFVATGVGTSAELVQRGQGAAAVFRCPSDEAVFPEEKTSYFYNHELGEKPLIETFLFQVYKDKSRIPVFWDAQNFHGGSLPFNWLMLDGRVEHFTEPKA